MSARISLLMPTRGRRALAERFLHSVAQMSARPEEVEVVLCMDDDDPESHAIDYPGLTIRRLIGPRRSMGDYNMDCLAASSGEIIVLANDDMVIRTEGWDDKLRELDQSVPDGIYLAYGNDLFKKGDLCTFPILSRKTCQALIEPYHRAYRGAFIDYHLFDIFKRLAHAGYPRIFYLEDVVFEHLHYRTGKAAIDATYTARGRFDDDMLFVGLAPVRVASLPFLIEAIREGGGGGGRLPDYTPLARPANPWRAFVLFTRTFLMDAALPARWRFFLWWWFAARYVASHVLPGAGAR